jgi:hypothetical protein
VRVEELPDLAAGKRHDRHGADTARCRPLTR